MAEGKLKVLPQKDWCMRLFGRGSHSLPLFSPYDSARGIIRTWGLCRGKGRMAVGGGGFGGITTAMKFTPLQISSVIAVRGIDICLSKE